jgi:hypothetical protein
MQTSGLPLGLSRTGRSHDLPQQEDTRPDVFVLSHAAAYAAWYESMDEHRTWMNELVRYLGDAVEHPATVPGRPGLNKPMQLLWYAAPFVLSQAHAGTPHVTTHRVLAMDRAARHAMTKIGVPILDATMMTQSQWEAAYDGLHYLRGSNDNWNGNVAVMVFHAGLNAIFPDCDSSNSGVDADPSDAVIDY